MSQTKAQLISDLVQALNFTGTASAPANGAFLSAANTLALATNSAQRLTIDSTGRVLVGTTTPDPFGNRQLTVASSSSTHLEIRSGTSASGIIVFTDGTSGGTDSFKGQIKYNQASDFMTFETNGSNERLRINSSGNVGIGTTSPGEKLDVAGTIQLTNFLKATGDLLLCADIDNNNSGTALKFCVDGDQSAEKMRIDDSGNVGIGTTSVEGFGGGYKTLEVAGSTNANGGVFKTATADSAGSGSSGTEMLMFTTDSAGQIAVVSADPLLFQTANTERMRIDSAGNVGIGTSSPTKPSSSNANTRFMEISSADGADLILGNSATSVSVGDHIGTLAFKNVDSNPDSGVPHYAGIRCESANTSGSMDLRFYVGRGNLESDATNMIISAAGNVGIGTSSPDVNFHVSGTSSVAKIESTASSTSARLIIKSETDTYTGLHFGDTGDDDVGRIRYYHTDNHMQFSTGASERMRIDNVGNVGIGTSSAVNNSGYGGITLNGGNGAIFSFKDSDVEKTRLALVVNDAFSIQYPPGSSGHFRIDSLSADGSGNITGATERLRVHSGGEISFQTTSINLQGGGASDFMFTMRSDIGSNHNGVMIAQVASGHAALTTKPSGAHDYFAGFFLNNNSSGVGSIQITASATIFNTSSDYRLKENAVSISDGITRLKQLLPKRFNWIADETNTLQDGFFAHEVSSIVPEAVTGEKDAIATEDGGQYTKDEPIYQQIDHSKLVPLLTAALKEAISKIETLETKVAALEAA